MISKKYIKSLELEGTTIDDFYDYIIQSKVVGALSQAREYVNKLSGQQFLGFLKHLKEHGYEIIPYVEYRKW